MEKVSNKRKPYNTMLTVEKSNEIKFPHNVRWGKSAPNENTVTLTFKNLRDIFDLDLDHAFTTSQGHINYQRKGIPIGGYLSSFFANVVCSYHEYNYLQTLPNQNIIFGIRQIDDLLVLIATKKGDASTKRRAQAMKKKMLAQNSVYLGGLELEEEKSKTSWISGQKYLTHEFAGTEISIRESQPIMICRTLNKNKESIRQNGEQIIVRYPPWESYTTKQSKRGVIIGTLHRVEQQNSSIQLATESMIENFEEYKAIKYEKDFYISTLKRFIKRNALENNLTTIAKKVITRIINEY